MAIFPRVLDQKSHHRALGRRLAYASYLRSLHGVILERLTRVDADGSSQQVIVIA
jgi:hypothetical protein